MPRGSSGSAKERLEKQFYSYRARHQRDYQQGPEGYEFDIKMRGINVPDIVRQILSQDDISERINNEQGDRLLYFAEEMKETYPWISRWGQAGRSGGWLFFTTEEPVLTDYLEIPVREDPHSTYERSPHEWMPIDLKPAEARLDDLIKIEASLKMAMTALKKDFANPAWWDVGPHDWVPKKKPKMGGVFDFMRKKKPPAKQDVIRLEPIEVIPSGGLIPAGPPAAGAFANPFDLLAPPPPGRGVVPFTSRAPEPMFDLLAPPAAAASAWAPREAYRPPPPPIAPVPPPVRARRARVSWRLPTPEELAGQLRSTLNLPGIFSQVRAVRKGQEFRRELDRWAARGLPGIIPISPVATREIYGDFARFFGVPLEILDSYARQDDVDPAIWDGLLWPLFDTLSEAFEIEKPADLPGWFALEHDPDTDEWWLVYLETD